jgi:hypothetical protein
MRILSSATCVPVAQPGRELYVASACRLKLTALCNIANRRIFH